MAKSGTPAEVTASKRRSYVYIPIDIGSGRTSVVAVRGDHAEYFGIQAPAGTASGYTIVTRKSTGRELYVDLQDTTGVASETDTNNKFALPAALSARGGGKKIKVPTELKTTKGNTRMATFHFTSKATLGAISNFLFNKTTTHKPTYFYSPAGARRAVVNIPSADINAGEDATAEPAA